MTNTYGSKLVYLRGWHLHLTDFLVLMWFGGLLGSREHEEPQRVSLGNSLGLQGPEESFGMGTLRLLAPKHNIRWKITVQDTTLRRLQQLVAKDSAVGEIVHG